MNIPRPFRPVTTRRSPGRRRQSGIALLEAMLAVVILGIGLLGTIGLQARAYAALNDAGLRAEATMAADKLLAIITTDAANVGNYALDETGTPNATMLPWVTETRTYIPNAKIAVVVTPQARRSQVDVTIRWSHKAGGVENRHVVTSYIGF